MTMICSIVGYCPSCGEPELSVISGGLIMCQNSACSGKTVVTALLNERETGHIVVIDRGSWSAKHPLRERLNDELLDCALAQFFDDIGAPPNIPLGRYRVPRGHEINDDKWELLPEGS